MMTLETMRMFFGWCTVINFGVLIFASLAIVVMRTVISGTHAKMFGLREEEVCAAYFSYLANYKIATLILNLAPYLALRMIA